MLSTTHTQRYVAAALALLVSAGAAGAQQVDPWLYSGLEWRMIGPFRGGRTVAAVGVPGDPTVFYIGSTNGGVWRSNDYGRVWTPIFDQQPTGSIGAIAVAPSSAKTIYVGTGEGLQRPDLATGDGIYRSDDGGDTWKHGGLPDAQQIADIAVDPRDPNRLFVAALGHPYGPNAERGVFRSTDGGQTFEKVLGPDENTGAVQVMIAPNDPNTVYAVLWAARQAPWEMGSSWTLSADNGLFKSTDGGTTWSKIGDGLPTADDSLGRIGFDISRSNPSRMYAVAGATKNAGIYRSDDAGAHWTRLSDDERLWGRDGDFNEIRVDPKNADVVYIANVVTWKSADGGKTWSAFRGAPGGDDYHRVWVDPDDSQTILIAADQGAIVTVNGGQTWSSWYNQPTAQMFHVNADNAFPYRLCGGQQESGSACVQSRGDDGQITFREWHPVGVEEYGYAVPDPLDPDVVFGGKVTRYDRRTGQVQNVGPTPLRGPDSRTVRTAPLVFSTADPHALFFGTNVVWKTLDGGKNWTKISGDLTRDSSAVPANLGAFTALDPQHGAHRGVIYTIAPSPRSVGWIWAGNDDGLIHLTRDGGKSWVDVTPPELRDAPWSKISIIDASPFDTLEAYAAVNTFRRDELHPLIYRTTDGGKSWTKITAGIADGAIVNVVRADPKKRGLLFAGTETQVWVSFDDGDHWQSLRLNMPATSIRDLIVKDDDIAIATHGRGFWILDDATPLRQVDPASSGKPAILYAPAVATRFRWDKNTDTPLPPDEPAAENPPDGAIIDYFLSADGGKVTIEIVDPTGRVVRRYASDDKPEAPIAGRNIPDYWIRPPQLPSTEPGMHRFVWDLRYETPPFAAQDYPIAAVYRDTPREPRGLWALPGRYTVRLTANGVSYTQPLVIRMDPRVKAPLTALVSQFTVARRLDDDLRSIAGVADSVAALRGAIDSARTRASGVLADSLAALGDRVASVAAPNAKASPATSGPGLLRLRAQITELYSTIEDVDAAPTPATLAAVRTVERQLSRQVAAWRAILATELPAFNARLRASGQPPITPP